MSVQNAFDQKKKSILHDLASIQPDLSPKGTVDELCLPIIHLINSHPDMVTTSSCSGRISVFAEGLKDHKNNVKVGGKGQGGAWLHVSHDEDNVLNWIDSVTGLDFSQNNNTLSARDLLANTRYILYKYEPFIIHVKCRNFEMAAKLYNTAMACGFRESGIGSNFLVAIRINIKMDIPIGYIDESENMKLFVSQDYIHILDKLTLIKFSENRRKMDDLYKKFNEELIEKDNVNSKESNKETKEERRERKRREGLKRQLEMKSESAQDTNQEQLDKKVVESIESVELTD
ncbi:tRNA methyltransferase TYW3 NDAI_0D02870 [Naumovozyma dairenensis CBS 421]|uniref:tRNA wybutosine-synthesizing protein 3 n=1 Tax=Naumovozyma dairenensis (strain ATCC 10597 / BCRC 20456 / CBS 421 / NBRC 0211 / NRRL Y-12639) TaxID=1071378 RepID=G0W9Z0_NAUDC|nr:hypothetical protein NDAI_0D02870 [Naumovozyma dairenensis CBS 421]CCD24601.1 hypothetical protein NDAI_0D02870 [Naumovozyma dairenensis CBS 421]